MIYPPSAVQVQRTAQSVVPDNTNTLNLIGNLGNKVEAYQEKKQKNALRSEGEAIQSQLINQQQAQASAQVDAQAGQAIGEVEAKAAEQKEIIRSNAKQAEILSVPENKMLLLRLANIDTQIGNGSNMASTVLDMAKSADAMETEAARAAMAQGNADWKNYSQLATQFDIETADAFMAQSGRANPAMTEAMLDMTPDQKLGYAAINQALTGEFVAAPMLNEMDQERSEILGLSPKDWTADSLAAYERGDIERGDLVRFRSATDNRNQAAIGDAVLAARTIPILKRSLSLLESVGTGGFAERQLRASQWFGIESANEAELANKLGKAVISQYREVFGAAFTAPEGDKLDRIEAGMGKSGAGNKRVINQLMRMSNMKIKHGRSRAVSLEDNDAVYEIDDYLNMDLTPIDEQGADTSNDQELLNKYGL